MTEVVFDPSPIVAAELQLPIPGVIAVIKLLAEGATVPFIARYRKEVTGGLDEVQIRAIEERSQYLAELDSQRQTVLKTIREQGKLTAELEKQILACTTKAALEDLYLPFKPKRRTRAMIAIERGLEPLALRILAQSLDGQPENEAAAFVDPAKEVPDVQKALAGARDIVAERVAENAEVRSYLREAFLKEGTVHTEVVPEKKEERTKFEDYYDYNEPSKAIPSHRFLAIRRGENEGILRMNIRVDNERCIQAMERMAKLDPKSPWADQLRLAVADAFKRLASFSVETDARITMKMNADREAVDVFADNLKNLLLAAPFGAKPVIGIDPGIRTGCKIAAVDGTGKYLTSDVIYPGKSDAQAVRSKEVLLAFVKKFQPMAIAVGNGTGGRETEQFVRSTLREANIDNVIVVPVSEAGASVYSASDVAREEFPDLDLTIRGAISIARRLQDPLAELVKIDPKSIGVGQYQHDVQQSLLGKQLGQVVESCVNAVGVELNTASASLLSYVSGVGATLAKRIVTHREANGAFESRLDLSKVSGLGPKTFMLAAGFLRVRGGKHPLDASGVHPERYDLVEKMAADLGVNVGELIGNPALVARIDIRKYVSADVGEPTLQDILAELKKPGRDPRSSFEPPKFRDDVNSLEDLQEGMVLEGVVTNVTAFGAFVDVGVHQDGLVHVSQLSDKFVKDPREVVRVGDKLKVRVLEVDKIRRRISLSAKSGAPASSGPRGGGQKDGAKDGARGQMGARPAQPNQKFSNNPFSNLLKR